MTPHTVWVWLLIALSASAMERDVRRAIDEGFDHYLTKPVKVGELLHVLDGYLSGKQRVS